MIFEKYKLIVFELNSLFDYLGTDDYVINLSYLELIKKLKLQGKFVCGLVQGTYSNREVQMNEIQNSDLFNEIIENTGYGELAMIELHDMVNSFVGKYDVKQDEIMLVTNKKLDKYLSLDIFAVNWDEVL